MSPLKPTTVCGRRRGAGCRDGDGLVKHPSPGKCGAFFGTERRAAQEAEARLVARTPGTKCRYCRREGIKLFLKGERCLTEKCAVERRSYPPGEHGRGRIKQSEYLLQLREKQKARRYYGLLKKQFRTTYERASRQ